MELKIFGVWVGFNFALFVICLGCAIFVYRMDWEKESIRARIRAEASPIQGITSVFEDTPKSSFKESIETLN